jgi:PAS domain S-box-containing protein
MARRVARLEDGESQVSDQQLKSADIETPEARYELLVQSITDYAICFLDAEGHVASWNAGAERFHGYSETEIIGEHFAGFYAPEDQRRGAPQQNLAIAARDGSFEVESWRMRKDGTRFWSHVIIDPIRGPGGIILGYAEVTRDLTERRKAQLALRQSEEQFRVLVQGVTDYAVFMLSTEGRVTSWNPGAQRIKGYAADEIIGQHFSRFYSAEDCQAGAPGLALATAAREGRYEKEGWRIRKDGTRFWANVVMDAIRDDAGIVIGFAKITRDITERKRAEAALDEAREALLQSQKMEAVGQLTGGVAHDFNNLLAAVLGSLELLRKRLPDDAAMLKFLDNAMSAARRGAVLTQRMLAFARRQELNRVPLDISALLRNMGELLQSSLGPGVSLETRIPAALGTVDADANQLELAILNLVVNARDAMPAGGTITLGAKESQYLSGLAIKNGVCVVVSDTGEGMDEETLSKAAEPFFTTKGTGKGTGLGLSMVHGLAHQLGGKLNLRSSKGEGTTAELWIPLTDAMVGPAAGSQQPEPPRTDRRVILAVDDDALVLFNTAAMLEDMGHKVFEVSSGKAALEVVKREPGIDMVITDQAMPHMTGVELAREIWSLRPELPIIIATGYAELPPGAPSRLRKLAKPFGQEELASAIDAGS